MNPSFRKATFHNILFDFLDRYGRLVDTEHARRLAWSRTDATRELRKIISRMQLTQRFFPAPAINQIIPVGDEIVNGTSGLTEWNAAIHAARSLLAQFLLRKIQIDLKPIVDALCHRSAGRCLARIFYETRLLTHAAPAQAALIQKFLDSE